MINIARAGLFALFVLLPIFPAIAGSYYVAPNGGRGSGSINEPWGLDFANKQLLAGDKAILRGGQYMVSISPVNSGESDTRRIAYEAYPGEQPIIDLGINITGWKRYSGTDNNNAVYRTNDNCEDMVYSSFEKVGRYVMLWNRKKTATRAVPTTTDPALLKPGDYTHNGGYIYLRTGASNNPGGQNTRCTSGGNGINLVNKNYITVRGITIRNARRGIWFSGSSHNIVENNVVMYSAWRGIDLRENSNYNVVRNNTIKGAGSIQGHGGGGIQLQTSYNLVEGNDISWTGHDGLISEGGSYNIIRNNTFTKAFGKMIEYSANYGVIDHNRLYDGGKRKELIRQHNIDHPMISVGGIQVIVRQNTLSDGGLGINVTAFKTETKDIVIYNNTITQMNGNSHYSSTSNGVLLEWRPMSPNYYGIVFVNNLLFNNSGTSDRTSDHFDSQLGWNSEFDIQEHGVEFISNQVFSDKGYSQLINGVMNLSQFESRYGSVHDNISSGPLVNVDLSLKTGSPSGKFLTRTNGGGSGKVMVVDDARYFSDGHGIVPGDKIIVGGNAPVTIANIDYSGNTITLSQTLTWKDNDNVSFIYNGTAPTIGAGKTVEGSVPLPPKNLQLQLL